MPSIRHTHDNSRLVTLVAIILIVGVLYLAREVLIPLALAILLTFLLAPAVTWMQRHLRLGRIIAVLVVTTLGCVAIAFIGWIVAGQVIDLAGNLPQYRDNIREKIESIQAPRGGALERATEGLKKIGETVTEATSQPEQAAATSPPLPGAPANEPVSVEIYEPTPTPWEYIGASVAPLMGPLTSAGIVIIFTVFMLIQREDLRDRVLRLIGQGRLTVSTQAIDDAAKRVSRFLLMQLIVNVTYGIPAGIGLYFIGVPNALLWGVLATFLRFIPYVGPWIAAAMPVALTFAVFDGWSRPLATVGLFIVLELISNNLIEPILYGSKTGVSALAVLVSAVFWTWLWGPVGLMLATPLTVVIVVLGRYVPQLEFLAVLLGDAPALTPEARIYQRLLAMDTESVVQVAEEYLKQSSLVEFYEQVLIPAIGMAEHDRHRGMLDEGRDRLFYTQMRDLIEELGERHKADSTATRAESMAAGEATAEPQSPPAPRKGSAKRARRQPAKARCILCLPANDHADEIVALMLAQLLEFEGACATVLPAERLAAESADHVERQKPDVVFISAMPPLAVAHSRYLCKRLRSRVSDLRVVVGVWASANLEKATRRIANCGAERVVASLPEAVEYLRG